MADIVDDCQSEAVVLGCALSNVVSSLVALAGQADLPAGFLGAALLLAVLEGRLTLGVLCAGRVPVGALLLDALLGVGDVDHDGGLLLVPAVVVGAALEEVVGSLVLGDFEALLPAVLSVGAVVALIVAVADGELAPLVFATSVPLPVAVVVDALARVAHGNSSGLLDLVEAVPLDDAGPVDIGVLVLFGAVVPAADVALTLSVTFLESVDAALVAPTGHGLIEAVFFDALLGGSQGHSSNGESSLSVRLEAVVGHSAAHHGVSLTVVVPGKALPPASVLALAPTTVDFAVMQHTLALCFTVAPLVAALVLDALVEVSEGHKGL